MAWGCLLLFKRKLQCLQNFKYDVAHRVNNCHLSAKFHGLILLVTLFEFKEREGEEEDEEFWGNRQFLFNPLLIDLSWWILGQWGILTSWITWWCQISDMTHIETETEMGQMYGHGPQTMAIPTTVLCDIQINEKSKISSRNIGMA